MFRLMKIQCIPKSDPNGSYSNKLLSFIKQPTLHQSFLIYQRNPFFLQHPCMRSILLFYVKWLLRKSRVRVSHLQENLGETFPTSQCNQVAAKERQLLIYHLQQFSHFTPRLSFSCECFRFPASMHEPVVVCVCVCVGGWCGCVGVLELLAVLPAFACISLRTRQSQKQQPDFHSFWVTEPETHLELWGGCGCGPDVIDRLIVMRKGHRT